MSATPKLAILMTCHNRREKTLACVWSLATAGEHVTGQEMSLFLVDDGSTDGTAEAVAVQFPRATIVTGTGDLYWNRGMVRAWEAALALDEPFDGFLLLNDDTVLDAHALQRLLSVDADHGGRSIIVGAVRDPDTGHLTYGGVKRTSGWHPGRVALLRERNELQPADAFNANCVYVPFAVCEAVGTLDPAFHHGMGDFDYGYRARRLGYGVIVGPGTVGTCRRNAGDGTWRDPSVPLRRRLKLLESPKGLPRKQWREFLARHGAPLPSLLSWMPTLQAIRSSAWRMAKRALQS